MASQLLANHPGRARAALFLVLFGTCLGLGYATLNRYRRDAEGLYDCRHYRSMARFEYAAVPEPFRHRVLVPTLAGAVLSGLEGLPLGSWDPEALSLLIVNAAFVALAALVLAEIARATRSGATATALAPLLYVASFDVANAHLAGIVDSVEGLVVCLVVWVVLERRFSWLPAVFALAALGKETAVAFAALYVAGHSAWTWRGGARFEARPWLALLAGTLVAAALISIVHALVGPGRPDIASLVSFASLPAGLAGVIRSRAWIYTFLVLGPLALPRLARLPPAVLAGSATMVLGALFLSALGRIGENASRGLFDTLAPVLCVSGAIMLGEIFTALVATRSATST